MSSTKDLLLRLEAARIEWESANSKGRDWDADEVSKLWRIYYKITLEAKDYFKNKV